MVFGQRIMPIRQGESSQPKRWLVRKAIWWEVGRGGTPAGISTGPDRPANGAGESASPVWLKAIPIFTLDNLGHSN